MMLVAFSIENFRCLKRIQLLPICFQKNYQRFKISPNPLKIW